MTWAKATVLTLVAAGAACPAGAAPRPAVQRDVEGYAIATCLGAQSSAYLKDQADGWGSNIVQRGHGGIEALTAVTRVVKAAVARAPLPTARDETRPGVATPLPIQFCAEIVDVPAVRRAIDAAVVRLGPAYRRAGVGR